MKKILVISWFYPPLNSSEGLVTFKLINNSKYEYDVFTQNQNTSWSYGNTVELKNKKNVTPHYSKSNKIEEWVNEAYKFFCDNKEKYDIVMTRSMPQESHVVGLKIKKMFPEVKWIASFGDPIKSSPYHHLLCDLYSKYSLKNKINQNRGKLFVINPKRILYNTFWNIKHYKAVRIRKELDSIEDLTLKYCDKIILNNFSQEKYMFGKKLDLYKKSIILRHSFDPNFYPKTINKLNNKIKFVFVGHLDEIRTPLPLFKAIKYLRSTISNLEELAEFDFYGNMSSKDKIFLLDNDLLEIVKIKKPISYIESLKIMKEANWLIHIDGNIYNINEENIYFAAKIADYFGSNTNIIAITMQNGDSVSCLEKANSIVLSYSVEEIKNYLYLIISNKYKRNLNLDYIKEFKAINVAKEFDNMLKSLE